MMQTNTKVLGKISSSLRDITVSCVVLFCCFAVGVILFEPYLRPPAFYNFTEQFEIKNNTDDDPSIVNLSNSKSDVYEIIGDVRIHASSSTIFVGTSSRSNATLTSWTVKPYTRKKDSYAMSMVTPLKVNHASYNDTSSMTPMPKYCNKILATTTAATPPPSTPAVVFSAGGYTGNTFHDFDDVILPLYFTSRQFNRSVLFLVTDAKPGWLAKYRAVLRELSRYDVLEINGHDRNRDRVFCFNRVIVGLRADKNGEFIVEGPLMTGFTTMLRRAYSLPRDEVGPTVRPRMLVISRRVLRRQLLNERAVGDAARGLGFEVFVEEMSKDVGEVARLVNSFDVLVGVHGAGLTNMAFLPENASVVQIVPFGLAGFSRLCFKEAAERMKLRYSEYVVEVGETTLSEKYSIGDVNYTDPERVLNEKGFTYFLSMYLYNQDLNVDVGRFRGTLLRVLKSFRL